MTTIKRPPKSASADTVRAWEDQILTLAEEIARGRLADRETLQAFTGPDAVKRHLTAAYRNAHHESFSVVFLDSQHRPLAFRELFRGTLDSAAVYPREVVRETLAHGAAAVVLHHVHPSGLTEPSQADRQITRRLVDALALVDVRVLDHVITGKATEDAVSFADRGLL